MTKFDKHFKMSESDIIDYTREKLDVFGSGDLLFCQEIGDGNINYVFKVYCKETGKSIIIKHADDNVRSGGMLDKDRNVLEAEMLIIENKLAPGMVPKVYLYDSVMSCLVMEDLSDHVIMRSALVDYKTFDDFADNITDFLIQTLLPTTDLIMLPSEKKNLVKRYINPELCEISERLVYSEPYTNASGRNLVANENLLLVEELLYSDTKLHLEVAKLKNDFMSNAQALIHGDLHTGSIFIKPNSVKVIDPEFAFYGPMGYDIGNVIANLFFAWIHAYVEIGDVETRDDFIVWISSTIQNTIDLFKQKFIDYLEKNTTERMAKSKGFYEWYLNVVLVDTAGVTGLEIIRRIVGPAKVLDITGIKDSEAHALAERIGVLLGKELIINREYFKDGNDYILAFERITSEVSN